MTLAAQMGLVENVRLLLEKGASPNNTNDTNESPLLLGNVEVLVRTWTVPRAESSAQQTWNFIFTLPARQECYTAT